jgi:FtsP/CotA-like multicopper oxidase with cupredoxin domain
MKAVDQTTGAANAAIDWTFRVGERIKIRLLKRDGFRPPHAPPLPSPGGRRLLVLARIEVNLVWKDTVLVRTGQTVDILFDVTNPGLWMAHCHIPEHQQSGMMVSFTVTRV